MSIQLINYYNLDVQQEDEYIELTDNKIFDLLKNIPELFENIYFQSRIMVILALYFNTKLL
jgi:hypothetical protein